MEKLEFRVAPDGMVYYNEYGKGEKRLTRFSSEIVEPMLSMIEHRFPECYARLVTLYKKTVGTSSRETEVKAKIVERFIRCNFGEHDLLTADIERDIMNFEEVKCPLRGGFCPHENIICKPKGLIQLTPAEREVVKLYIEGYTFKEIAKRLGKSPSTVKTQLFQIKHRLKLNTCREIIKVCRQNKF